MKILLTALFATFLFSQAYTETSEAKHDQRPIAYFGDKASGTMDVDEIKEVDQIIAKDASGNIYEIARFTMIFEPKEGAMQMIKATSGIFNDRIIDLLSRTEVGTTIIFTDIHCKFGEAEEKALESGIIIEAFNKPTPTAYFGKYPSGSRTVEEVQEVENIIVRDENGKVYELLRFTMVFQEAEGQMMLDKTNRGAFSSRMKEFLADAHSGAQIIFTDIHVKDGDKELRLDNGIIIAVK